MRRAAGRRCALWAACVLVVCGVQALGMGGPVSMETVWVGNAGNAPDDTGFGAVGYGYWIGKYEVTAGQYCAFLQAVGAEDPYGLYDEGMWTSDTGCKIERTGFSGGYQYSVAANWADRPVNYVSWGDAARFCNWLANGQPTGAQGPGTTEEGTYLLNGVTDEAALVGVVRQAGATWALPTEDEWYKAAYHGNDSTDVYYDYATGNDDEPSAAWDLGGNNATYWGREGTTIGSPYWRTEVGTHENSASPYGTFDQSGNAWETLESTMETTTGTFHVLRGGSFFNYAGRLSAGERYPDDTAIYHPDYGWGSHGFRVVQAPEPGTMGLLVLGGIGWLRRRR